MLSEKIYTLRKKSGLSQEQLAEKLNVSRQAVSKWESGISMPESEKLILLSEFFGVSVDDLIKDKSKKTNYNTKTKDYTTIIGIMLSIAGVIGMLIWEILSITSSNVSQQISESSAIQLDGNAIFLIICICTILIGIIVLLRKK